jgi:outer membrane protein TolC
MTSFKTIAFLFLGAGLLLSNPSSAQEVLTVEQAIKIGLEHNYDIQIVTREQETSENNVTLGNAGLLPSLDARVTRDFSQNDVRNQFESTPPPDCQ